jgi:hypothetical protein
VEDLDTTAVIDHNRIRSLPASAVQGRAKKREPRRESERTEKTMPEKTELRNQRRGEDRAEKTEPRRQSRD